MYAIMTLWFCCGVTPCKRSNAHSSGRGVVGSDKCSAAQPARCTDFRLPFVRGLV